MPGIRVTGGHLRGRRLRLPEGVAIRPTSDRARQAFFNIVQSRLSGSRFLDLFAGTGIFAIEAISRGAREAIAIDSSRHATSELSLLAHEWSIPLLAIPMPLPDGLARLGSREAFDIIYADPPYDAEVHGALVRAIESHVPLSPDAIVAIEHRAGRSPFDGLALDLLERRREARYGNVGIAFFSLRGSHDESN